VYIRTKQWQGHTYYQVVETHREGAKIRQKILVSLGSHSTVTEALTAAKREWNRLRRERGRWPGVIDPKVYSKTDTTRLARLDVRITEAAARIELLTGIRDKMKTDAKQRSAKRKTTED